MLMLRPPWATLGPVMTVPVKLLSLSQQAQECSCVHLRQTSRRCGHTSDDHVSQTGTQCQKQIISYT